MSDIGLKWTTPYSADVFVQANDLGLDDGLKTAVMLSLFTDRRADDTDILPSNANDRRGWWADALSPLSNDRIGSRLWLLSRSKETQEALIQATAYVREALQWMLDDGVAAAVTVATEFTDHHTLGILVQIDRPTDTPLSFRFGYAWAAEVASEAV